MEQLKNGQKNGISNYDETQIQVLEGLEAVRKGPVCTSAVPELKTPPAYI